jgi:hypothetical protein
MAFREQSESRVVMVMLLGACSLLTVGRVHVDVHHVIPDRYVLAQAWRCCCVRRSCTCGTQFQVSRPGSKAVSYRPRHE